MSGVTDLPFRQLAYEFGAGFVVTEMVASRELVGNTAESWSRLQNSGIRPHIVQLAGRDPHYMAEGARIAEANGADIIDINMGCPAKKVIGGLSGSALMREPELALSLIKATVEAVRVPVTVKMRLGWDDQSINAPDLAAAAEDLGVQMVTVHGRTRMQFYQGKANWDLIASVRRRISIPLVANGDVETPADIAAILRKSGADAVMIGRGSQGRPWHAGVLAGTRGEPDRAEMAEIFERHYRMTIDFYGGLPGLRHARKHVGWTLDRIAAGVSAPLRTNVLTSNDPEFVIASMRDIIVQTQSDAPISEAA
jgi:nifR3 family TIM-barrel protein